MVPKMFRAITWRWFSKGTGAPAAQDLGSRPVPIPDHVEVAATSLSALEAARNISETVCDLSPRYLGLPPSKKFYKEGETDFDKTRSEFDAALKRLGLENVD